MKQIFIIFMTLLPLTTNADGSGRCGNHTTWSFEEAAGTLTISGSGAKKNFTIYSDSSSNIH